MPPLRKSVFLVAVSLLPGVLSPNNQGSVGVSFNNEVLFGSYSASSIEGSSVAVFGCGAIGLGVISTSVTVGASRIIAVDTNPGKESWARKFGAHEFVNPTTLPEGKRIQDYLAEITDGGLDFTFDATGNVSFLG